MLSRRRLNIRRFSRFCVCFTDPLCIPLVDRDDKHAVAVGESRDGSVDCERSPVGATDGALACPAPAVLDRVSLGEDSAESAVRTAKKGNPITVDRVADRLRDEEWTKKAVASGLESALSVPLAVDDRSHGVIAAYASEPEAFTALPRFDDRSALGIPQR